MKNKKKKENEPELMQKLVALCKRRGFVFQSSEIYGGLRSAYDYGPLGVELKRNIMNEWWRSTVHARHDVVGLDSSIIMHPRVWEASGHVDGFNDPLVDCRECKTRFRADHAPPADNARGYVCPACGSDNMSDERQFNLMFRTNLGPVDSDDSTVYLRPETAQGMFVNFSNVQQTYRLKLPFGIAQMGKSFRNEVTVEHFIYRSCEFEQMEMEFFVEPGTDDQWLEYWKNERYNWYLSLGATESKLRLRPHEGDELAHYAKACYDVEYEYPWGWGELEGIANRTDYDLRKHQEHSRKRLTYFDPQKKNPETGKNGCHFLPYVIEPAAGATRTTLMFLIDAYTEEPPSEKRKEGRTLLKLHPRLAPIKCAVMPLVKKDEWLRDKAREIVTDLFGSGINAFYDEKDAIGRRYARQDEAGTPYCLTIDAQTKDDDTVTIRERDSMDQERIPVAEALDVVRRRVWA
jgi:glycyl-tRNA synthetase